MLGDYQFYSSNIISLKVYRLKMNTVVASKISHWIIQRNSCRNGDNMVNGLCGEAWLADAVRMHLHGIRDHARS